MKIQDIQARFEKAVHLFMDDQGQLLKLNANERAVGATLAHLFLRNLFPNHQVDAEYNRVGLDGSAKRLNLPMECGGENARVFPDIVVHLQPSHRSTSSSITSPTLRTSWGSTMSAWASTIPMCNTHSARRATRERYMRSCLRMGPGRKRLVPDRPRRKA